MPLADDVLAAIVAAATSDPATTDAAAKQLDRLARAYRYRRDVRAGLKPTNHQDGFLSQAEAARASGLWRNRSSDCLPKGDCGGLLGRSRRSIASMARASARLWRGGSSMKGRAMHRSKNSQVAPAVGRLASVWSCVERFMGELFTWRGAAAGWGTLCSVPRWPGFGILALAAASPTG